MVSENPEKVLLVGADFGEADFAGSFRELQSLAEACGMQVTGVMTQRLQLENPAFLVGSGKTDEIREFAEETEAELVVFENALSPSQLKNLQRKLNRPVMDRTALILEIFALRAGTAEAKIQVETARLQYLLPRLSGMYDALTRQGGTSGSMSSRGAGEKKLELDRRYIEHRISALKKELKEVEQGRRIQRKQRQEGRIPRVALVGYTNAGKSTVLNGFVNRYVQDTDKTVLEKDMLFATLETTVRRISQEGNRDFLLSDTVGFIHKLPHGLVEAFHSTLEEVKEADLLLHIVDFSDSDYREQIRVTGETLSELGAGGIPVIYVFNKADLSDEFRELPKVFKESNADCRIYMSAKDSRCIEALAELVTEKLYSGRVRESFLFPYSRGEAASYFMEHSQVEKTEYRDDGIYIETVCDRKDCGRFSEYKVKNKRNNI